jgi:hypothetical protein
MVPDLPSLLGEIDRALAAGLAVDTVERTLTDGYAHALELEAERWRIERRFAELARLIGDENTPDRAAELASLSQRLSRADRDLAELRRRLATLRRHAATLRAA